MALTAIQKQEIEAAIDYLFDAPTNAAELEQMMAHIQNAFRLKETENDPLFSLQTFIYKPADSFGRLQNSNNPDSPATIGEVQEHIAHIAYEKIIDARVALSLPPEVATEANKLENAEARRKVFCYDEKPWKDEISQFLQISLAYTDSFASYVYHGASFAQVIQPPEEKPEPMVYEFTTQECPEEKAHRVKVTVNLSDDQEPVELLSEASFASPPDEAQAESVALKTASEVIVASLLENHFIDSKGLQKVNDLTYDIITHPLYLKKIQEQKLAFSAISQLRAHEHNSLFSRPIIQLIEEDKCSVNLAKCLREELMTDPFYAALYQQEAVSLEALAEAVEDDKVKALLSPPIKKLIKEGAITVREAVAFQPIGVRLLREDGELYFQKILVGQLAASDIATITEDQCNFLLSHEVMSSLATNTISIETIIAIMRSPILNLMPLPPSIDASKKYTNELTQKFLKELVQLAGANILLKKDFDVIANNLPDIFHCLAPQDSKEAKNEKRSLIHNKNIFKLCVDNLEARLIAIHHRMPMMLPNGKDCLHNLLTDLNHLGISNLNLMARILFMRLDAILLGNPYSIHRTCDTIAQLKQDLDKMINHIKLSKAQLMDKVFDLFLNRFLQSAAMLEDLTFYRFIQNEIENAQKPRFFSSGSQWTSAFSNVVLEAGKNISNKKRRIDLFSSSSSERVFDTEKENFYIEITTLPEKLKELQQSPSHQSASNESQQASALNVTLGKRKGMS